MVAELLSLVRPRPRCETQVVSYGFCTTGRGGQMSTMNGVASQPTRTEASAVRRILDEAEAVTSAKRGHVEPAISKAQHDLRQVVQAANDSGVSWQSIGEILGIRRGAAYQRFRRQRADYAASRRR